MTASRTGALIALTVSLVSVGLVLGALSSQDAFADSRLLTLGWVVVPAVGAAAYLGSVWGLLAALGALAPRTVRAFLDGSQEALEPLLLSGGAVALAVLVGRLARVAERREHP